MSHAHQQRCARRQREQNAEKAEHLPERQQREDHGDRMQADALADQHGRHQHAFQCLARAEGDPDEEDPGEAVELQQGGDGAECSPDEGADIRDEDEAAGDHANRQGEFEVREPQRGGVEEDHYHDHQQLPAQELGQHGVDLAGDGEDLCAPPARENTADAGEQVVPVAQEVEQHHRHQQQVDEEAEQCEAADLQRSEQLLHEATVGLDQLGQELLGGLQVEHDCHAQVRLHQRGDIVVQPGQEVRQAVHHHPRLPVEERQHHEHEPDHDHEGQQHHDDHRRGAPDAGLEPVYERVEDIRDDRAREERGEDGRQQPDQPRADCRDGEP